MPEFRALIERNAVRGRLSFLRALWVGLRRRWWTDHAARRTARWNVSHTTATKGRLEIDRTEGVRTGWASALGTSSFVMPDDFGDDEPQEALAEARVEIGFFGQPTQTGDLHLFTTRISSWQAGRGLVLPDCLCDLEPLSKKQNECRIDVVDTGSEGLELRI